ncbi:MAG: sigma-70 family RNA polymerase sigma factor [bacterium]|nr:sigma-70 family RNA polymerase sigma factor [bacterium]
MSEETEDALARARDGDRDALDELLRRNQDRLEFSAKKLIGRELRARLRTSDILQATYLDVVSSVGGFRGDSEDAFCAWVVRILTNNVRDAGKHARAGKRDVRREVPNKEATELEIPGTQPTPSAEVALGEELLIVSRALKDLPEDYRKIIILHVVAGVSHEEAAKQLDRTPGATRVLLARARAALLLKLEQIRGR